MVLGRSGKILTPPWCEALQPAKPFLSFLAALCPCVRSQSRPARSEDRGGGTGTVPAAVTTFVAVGTSLLKRLQDHEVRWGLRAPRHAPGFPGCRGRGASHLTAPLPSCRHFVPRRRSCCSSWTNAIAPHSFPRELPVLGLLPRARSNTGPQGAGCSRLPLLGAWSRSHAFPFVTVHLDLSNGQDNIRCDFDLIS